MTCLGSPTSKQREKNTELETTHLLRPTLKTKLSLKNKLLIHKSMLKHVWAYMELESVVAPSSGGQQVL